VDECFFWYWPTWVVPDKGPLNGCVCVSSQRCLNRMVNSSRDCRVDELTGTHVLRLILAK